MASHANVLLCADSFVVKLEERGLLAVRGLVGDAITSEDVLPLECLRTGQVIKCDDTWSASRREFGRYWQLGVRSLLILPIVHERRSIGVLELFSKQAGAFGEQHVRALQVVADWVPNAIPDAAPEEKRSFVPLARGDASQIRSRSEIPGSSKITAPAQRRTAIQFRPRSAIWIVGLAAVLFLVFGLRSGIVGRNVAPTDWFRAQSHERAAAELISQGKLDPAIDELNAALRLQPRNARLYYDLGAALFRQGKFEHAAVAFRNSLHLKPNFAPAHSGLGMSLFRLQREDAAMVEFYMAIRDDSTDADSHYYLGMLLASRGMLDEAIAEYQEALRISPNHAAAHSGLALADWTAGTHASTPAAAAQYFDAAWNEIHTAQSLGGTVDPSFISALHQRMPDPAQQN